MWLALIGAAGVALTNDSVELRLLNAFLVGFLLRSILAAPERTSE